MVKLCLLLIIVGCCLDQQQQQQPILSTLSPLSCSDNEQLCSRVIIQLLVLRLMLGIHVQGMYACSYFALVSVAPLRANY
jgi:hypothetical protein